MTDNQVYSSNFEMPDPFAVGNVIESINKKIHSSQSDVVLLKKGEKIEVKIEEVKLDLSLIFEKMWIPEEKYNRDGYADVRLKFLDIASTHTDRIQIEYLKGRCSAINVRWIVVQFKQDSNNPICI